jgi:hypothetical protein
MRVVYDPSHVLHDPATEVQYGVVMPMFEVAARVESIRAALLADDKFSFADPADHGLGPVTAVHHEGLVRFLAEAWSLWRTHGGGGGSMPPQFMPDTVLHPAMREGMGEAPEPSGATGRIGYWCWETMTPLVAGSYRAARAAVGRRAHGRRPAAGRGCGRLRIGPAAWTPLPPIGVRRLRPVQLFGGCQRVPGDRVGSSPTVLPPAAQGQAATRSLLRRSPLRRSLPRRQSPRCRSPPHRRSNCRQRWGRARAPVRAGTR